MLHFKKLDQLIRTQQSDPADKIILTRDASGKITGVEIVTGVHHTKLTESEDVQAAVDFFKLSE